MYYKGKKLRMSYLLGLIVWSCLCLWISGCLYSFAFPSTDHKQIIIIIIISVFFFFFFFFVGGGDVSGRTRKRQGAAAQVEEAGEATLVKLGSRDRRS